VAPEWEGRRNRPFRYWLPGREAELDADVLVRLEELPPLDQGAWFRMANAVLSRRRGAIICCPCPCPLGAARPAVG
jgi:hypothetical protein